MSESNERAKAPRRHHGPMGGGPGRPVEKAKEDQWEVQELVQVKKQKILKEH